MTGFSACSGDGRSTVAFAWYCLQTGGQLFTVDVRAEALGVCRRLTGAYSSVIRYVQQDSVDFLLHWADRQRSPIHLLYLDSLDYHYQDASERHSLSEAMAALAPSGSELRLSHLACCSMAEMSYSWRLPALIRQEYKD